MLRGSFSFSPSSTNGNNRSRYQHALSVASRWMSVVCLYICCFLVRASSAKMRRMITMRRPPSGSAEAFMTMFIHQGRPPLQRRFSSTITTKRPAYLDDAAFDQLPRLPIDPMKVIDVELTHGVAGSRKTQHAVNFAYSAMSHKDGLQNILFLVKVGTNAQEIRSRLERMHAADGLVFKRHKNTNHFVARQGRKKSYWVTNYDAFVDCQLRAHEGLKDELMTRGANFDWKRRQLLNLVRHGQHQGFLLKDGSAAEMVIVDEAQDLRREDVEILSRLVEQCQLVGGPLKKVLVVGDMEQTVFPDVLAGGPEHPLSQLATWMPSIPISTRRLDINYRCPQPHIHFNNLGMSRIASALAQPSPDLHQLSLPTPPSSSSPSHLQQQHCIQHKPYLFTYIQSSSPVQNYDAFRTARRIAKMVVTLLRTVSDLNLSDIAITSRFVNVNLVLLQLEDVLERELAEAGITLPSDGSGRYVHLFRTKVTDRRSINWEEAGQRLVMGSLTAFKGKDWRVVILLDCTEGVLPSKSSVHTHKELVDLSLFNVGTTRSREMLFVGFDAKGPSRYLAQMRDTLPEIAQLEWEPSTVENHPAYQEICQAQKGRRQADVEWIPGRNETVRVPFKAFWAVTDTTDEIATAGDILGHEGNEVYGFRSIDKFGGRIKAPEWFKTDEIGRLITGVMGEAILSREMQIRGLLSKRADATLLWPVLEKLGRPGSSKRQAFFTDDPRILNLATDYELNEYWAHDEDLSWRDKLEKLLEEHPKADTGGVLRKLLEGSPKCILHKAHEASLETLRPLLDVTMKSNDLPVEAFWNAAILYQDCMPHGQRHPTLIRRLLEVGGKGIPASLDDLLEGLTNNVIAYCDFKKERNSTSFTQGNAVGLYRTEVNEQELAARGFCRERDQAYYANGWTYGVSGRLDFMDENRKRIVEIKVSDTDGVAPMHEVQTLWYALLAGRGWKPTRAYEVVNLLRGVRYKRVLRSSVKFWPAVERGMKKLDFDEEMIEALGREYGPYYWEQEEEGEEGGEEREGEEVRSKGSRGGRMQEVEVEEVDAKHVVIGEEEVKKVGAARGRRKKGVPVAEEDKEGVVGVEAIQEKKKERKSTRKATKKDEAGAATTAGIATAMTRGGKRKEVDDSTTTAGSRRRNRKTTTSATAVVGGGGRGRGAGGGRGGPLGGRAQLSLGRRLLHTIWRI